MIALTAGQTAQGKSVTRITVPHKHLTLVQTIKWQHRIIKHDRWVISTRKSHKVKIVKWHYAQLKWTILELQQSLRRQHLLYLRRLRLLERRLLYGVCTTCWDNVARCESHLNWSEVTGNGFYWGLQWVPSTWNTAAKNRNLPNFNWFL